MIKLPFYKRLPNETIETKRLKSHTARAKSASVANELL
jgi:hypothetical protein